MVFIMEDCILTEPLHCHQGFSVLDLDVIAQTGSSKLIINFEVKL